MKILPNNQPRIGFKFADVCDDGPPLPYIIIAEYVSSESLQEAWELEFINEDGSRECGYGITKINLINDLKSGKSIRR